MLIHLLTIKRTESYKDQYAAEVVEVMDEYSYEQNSQWFHDKKKEWEAYDDVTRVAHFTLEVPYTVFDRALFPEDYPHKI
jgi:hypothetical protein